MESRPLAPWEPGWVLARPARGAQGEVLASAGLPLTKELSERLVLYGLERVTTVRVGQALPRIAEHLDRYGPDAEEVLARLFAGTGDDPRMARLLAAATAHAVSCRTDYRG